MTEDQFETIPVFDGEVVRTGTEVVPMQERGMVAQANIGGGLMSADQARAIAEVQAAMYVAKSFPRDEHAAYMKIMKSCQRHTLADAATYNYPRGGKNITGPTIRLAEVLSRHWGNLDSGFRELGRQGNRSEVEAYCWDMETNTRFTRKFSVKHWRDTKMGGEQLTAERDIYELVANMAQRRVRACILAAIPGDIVEAALNECEKTMRKSDVPLEDRVRNLLRAFEQMGVTQAMIEEFVGHKTKDLTVGEVVNLNKMGNSIRDGATTVEELFKKKPQQAVEEKKPEKPKPTPPAPEPEPQPTGPAPEPEQPPKKRTRRTREQIEADRKAKEEAKAPAKTEAEAAKEALEVAGVHVEDEGTQEPDAPAETQEDKGINPKTSKPWLTQDEANTIIQAMDCTWKMLDKPLDKCDSYDEAVERIANLNGLTWTEFDQRT